MKNTEYMKTLGQWSRYPNVICERTFLLQSEREIHHRRELAAVGDIYQSDYCGHAEICSCVL